MPGAWASVRAARGRRRRILALGGGGQAVIGFTTLLALRWIPVATLVFLFYTYPSWIAVIAAARGRERLDGTRIAALALSLGGIVLMVGAPHAGTLHPAGVSLALGSALLYALYVPFLGGLSDGVSTRIVSALVAFGAGVCFVATGAIAAGVRFVAPALMSAAMRQTLDMTDVMKPAGWAAIAALAVVSTAFAFVAFLNGLAVLGPVRTAIVSTVEPFWTALLGAVVLHQRLGVETLVGGVAIAMAVTLLQLSGRTAVTTDPSDESVS